MSHGQRLRKQQQALDVRNFRKDMNAAWAAAAENAPKPLKETDPNAYYEIAFRWLMAGIFLVILIFWLSK